MTRRLANRATSSGRAVVQVGDAATRREAPRFLRRVAESRVVQFVLLGALVFALAPKRESRERTAEIPSATIAALTHAEAVRRNVPRLGPAEEREVASRAIEDELLYREALRLSLDRDDPLVRQRLIQKLLLVVEDLGGASRAPSESELRAYYDAHRDRLRNEDRVHFVHVYAPSREGLPEGDLAIRGLPALGEPFPYPRDVDQASGATARAYGAGFAAAISALPVGAWSAPVQSTFGWHRVRVDARTPGGQKSFEEARAEIALEVVLARRERVVSDYMTKLASEYRLESDGRPITDYQPTKRLAQRADPSAED